MDRQTMLPKDFRIVVIDDGRDPARRRSLESLVTNRMNIQLIDTSGAARSGIDAALQQVNGSYLLVVEDGDSLTRGHVVVARGFGLFAHGDGGSPPVAASGVGSAEVPSLVAVDLRP